MGKIYTKLLAVTLALLLSVSVVVMSSYAWFVLSGNPVATGIQVTIGGGNTILIAPDMTEQVNGTVYHYPGYFSDKLNFGQHESYNYLKELGGLTPVSTADGVNWFLPDYYIHTDDAVRAGDALSGQLKPVEEFLIDADLQHANLNASEEQLIREGSYLYLDFWVVAPGGDYTLRLATGEDSGGTFLVDLMQVEETADGEGYTLNYPENEGAAAVRVGFLTNTYRITDNTMLHYQSSASFDNRYTSLRGLIQEADAGTADLEENRFTIFEPNADSHPTGIASAGSYVATNPVGLVNDKPTAVSVPGKVTVQKTSYWSGAEIGLGTALEQRFQTAILGMDLKNMDADRVADAFYNTYLQGQYSPYIKKGDFFKCTAGLYTAGSVITADQLALLDTAGATDDVYIIKLERNVPQRIRMFVWLEGQDVDCVNAVNASRFALGLELAGATE